MSKLTGTHSEVSEIDFTTLTTVPGTLKVHGAPIQILDLRAYVSFLKILLLFSSQLELSREQMMVEVEVDKVSTAFLRLQQTCSLCYAVIAGMASKFNACESRG
jgi:hypothetical protein